MIDACGGRHRTLMSAASAAAARAAAQPGVVQTSLLGYVSFGSANCIRKLPNAALLAQSALLHMKDEIVRANACTVGMQAASKGEE